MDLFKKSSPIKSIYVRCEFYILFFNLPNRFIDKRRMRMYYISYYIIAKGEHHNGEEKILHNHSYLLSV